MDLDHKNIRIETSLREMRLKRNQPHKNNFELQFQINFH